MSLLVGVQYTGGKAQSSQRVGGQEVIWRHGETINLPYDMAKPLLEHDGVFAQVPVKQGARSVVGRLVTVDSPPPTPVNLSAMGRDQILLFAKREFGVTLSENDSDEELRNRVSSLMRTALLDDLASEQESRVTQLVYMATADEAERFAAGMLELKLSPVNTEDQEGLDDFFASPKELASFLDSLTKPSLLEFAKKNKVLVSSRDPVDKIRHEILSAMTE